MPRPKKKLDEMLKALEDVTANLFLTGPSKPTIQQRVQQAIDRHPDLKNLLEPVDEELEEAEQKEHKAKRAVKTAKGLIEQHFDK